MTNKNKCFHFNCFSLITLKVIRIIKTMIGKKNAPAKENTKLSGTIFSAVA
jgi:hypothetical protein